MSDRQTHTTEASTDGLHCVYGRCQGFPGQPRPCHPGCYFQMTAIDELELLRRMISQKEGVSSK